MIFILTYADFSRMVHRIRTLVIKSFITQTNITILQIFAMRILIALVRLRIKTFVVLANPSRLILRAFIFIWWNALAFIPSQSVGAVCMTGTVVQSRVFTFVDDKRTDRARLFGVLIIIPFPTFAFVAIFFVEAVGEATAVVQ